MLNIIVWSVMGITALMALTIAAFFIRDIYRETAPMEYDKSDHITHADLARRMGVTSLTLSARIRNEGGLASVLVRRKGTEVVAYDRIDVEAWLERVERRAEPYAGEIVPAATARPLHEQGTYHTSRTSPQLSINMARAAEVYPHRLITPKSVGNGTERVHGFGRGA